jgi:hypothetical protein
MTEQSIDWSLEKLYPGPWYILPTVHEWFDQEFVRKFYKGRNSGTRYHPGQLRKFTRQDRRDGTKWRAHLAKMLFAMRRAVIEYAREYHSRSYDLWMLRNCRPAGGVWKGNRYYRGPTGKRCNHSLCPWCYLRRFNDFRNLCLSAPGKPVQFKHKNLTKPGLGFGASVNLSIFEAHGDAKLLHLFSQNEFRLRVQKACMRPYAQAEGGVERVRTPEFTCALRLFSMGFDGKHFVLRMGHIHKNKLNQPRMLVGSPKGLCDHFSLTRYENLDIDDALRKAQPFPINLLSGTSEGRDVVNALGGRKTFGVVRFKDPAARKSPAAGRRQRSYADNRYEVDCLSIGTSAT